MRGPGELECSRASRFNLVGRYFFRYLYLYLVPTSRFASFFEFFFTFFVFSVLSSQLLDSGSGWLLEIVPRTPLRLPHGMERILTLGRVTKINIWDMDDSSWIRVREKNIFSRHVSDWKTERRRRSEVCKKLTGNFISHKATYT